MDLRNIWVGIVFFCFFSSAAPVPKSVEEVPFDSEQVLQISKITTKVYDRLSRIENLNKEEIDKDDEAEFFEQSKNLEDALEGFVKQDKVKNLFRREFKISEKQLEGLTAKAWRPTLSKTIKIEVTSPYETAHELTTRFQVTFSSDFDKEKNELIAPFEMTLTKTIKGKLLSETQDESKSTFLTWNDAKQIHELADKTYQTIAGDNLRQRDIRKFEALQEELNFNVTKLLKKSDIAVFLDKEFNVSSNVANEFKAQAWQSTQSSLTGVIVDLPAVTLSHLTLQRQARMTFLYSTEHKVFVQPSELVITRTKIFNSIKSR